MYDKRGTRYTFGASDSGRQYDTSTGTSTNTYKWYLQEIRDTNSNYIKYTYSQRQQRGLPQPDYLHRQWRHRRACGRQLRHLHPPRSAHQLRARLQGDDQLSHLRNRRVIQRANRSQILARYGPGINGIRSLLTSLQQQGYDDNNNLTSLPATTFSYANSPAMFSSPSSGKTASARQAR